MHLKFQQFGRSTLLFGLVILLSNSSHSQDNYKIDFKIKGFKDSVVYLGYYFWESYYLADTSKIGSNGTFSFDGKKSLPPGVYMLITNSTNGKAKLFEFIIGSDQQFTLESSQENLIADMKVTGDIDNKIFFDDVRHIGERSKEAEPFIKLLQDSSISDRDQTKVEAREGFNKVSMKVKAYQNDLIKKYPTTVTARRLKANQEIEIPEAPVLSDGKKDPAFGYTYFKAHYWDNFNLADEALLRLPNPLYKEKLKYYLDKLVYQNPDSISKEIDALASIARKNKETYKYLVWRCITEYQQHPIMGMDAVYVHLSDKYLASGEMDFWLNEKAKKNFIDYASQLRRSLIGQTAANLIMQDQDLQPKNMYDIKKKYTILFIFDPDCGHCREETPKLVSFYNAHKTKFDLEVYAVSADSSMQKMKDYIKEMKMPWITVNGPRSYVGSYQNLYDANQTPSLYIIDSKKKIIAKKPPIEKLEDFLTHYEMTLKKKSPSP